MAPTHPDAWGRPAEPFDRSVARALHESPDSSPHARSQSLPQMRSRPVDVAALWKFIRRHRLAVVSTVAPGQKPEAAVVLFAATPRGELVFDTLCTSRKYQNLRRNPSIAVVIGWDKLATVQMEGVADEPMGADLRRLKREYFRRFPDGRERERQPGTTYIRIRPTWARFSDFNRPGTIVELGFPVGRR